MLERIFGFRCSLSPKKGEFNIQLKTFGDEVTYGNVVGFFKFRDTIYYRVKGAAGRTLDDDSLSFTDSLMQLYPDEFDGYSAKEIGTILVQPLRVVK